MLGGWLVTRRDLAIAVMRDAERFTVDDPRFSTAQVVGPSMLSLDGPEHKRHRDPFAEAFLKPDAKVRFAGRIQDEARRLVADLAPAGIGQTTPDWPPCGPIPQPCRWSRWTTKEARMRRIVVVLAVPMAIGAVVVEAAMRWRRNPRFGTAFVNSVVNPLLVRRGLAGRGRSEIGTLEHVGRRSGTKRLTPVHPETTPEGFRIVVPLGLQSEWARNVIASGECRIQLHGQVFDLDEPTMIDAEEAKDLPWPLRRVMAALGFKYLDLRTVAAHPASLAPMEEGARV